MLNIFFKRTLSQEKYQADIVLSAQHDFQQFLWQDWQELQIYNATHS